MILYQRFYKKTDWRICYFKFGDEVQTLVNALAPTSNLPVRDDRSNDAPRGSMRELHTERRF
ncbi:hypothetical protein COT49_00190 [candidate division WWE3 bacterium CG08_land_8_20_14_0_20_40_13]|uniref:Uncharacterized protein n=1 Tax=candidate division WWE3 bacterium CG08_land_8_20_14_0_20_40_13 TaxID=1975084 RepID=A0A2H0XER6_UNCKA|nr:MAG: hypothetical protein COT49_00190 [candidate division WWE3 bacterium CG08_land_8_20_14_0_20_40_13]